MGGQFSKADVVWEGCLEGEVSQLGSERLGSVKGVGLQG